MRLSLYAAITFLFFSGAVFPQGEVINWHVFDMGFGKPAGSNISVITAVGQPFVGLSTINNTLLSSGFLSGIPFPEGPVPIFNINGRRPVNYELNQNYPNPFNPTTTINFTIPKENAMVNLKIYNVNGRLVKNLYDGSIDIGYHKIAWDGKDDIGKHLPSGIYIVELKSEGFVKRITTTMIK